MNIVAYPVAGKAKSLEICRAFVEGSGGTVAKSASELMPGAAFFYGVDESNAHLWRQASDDLSRDYFYCDNAYFDETRQAYFRITKNRLQHCGRSQSDGKRFAALGLSIAEWRLEGKHIVVCPQSDSFMRTVVGFNGDWKSETVGALRTLTRRPLVVREWNRDKAALARTLGDDLRDAHALVTWSSAAAVTALLAGVPVVVGAQSCALPFSGHLSKLENLPRLDWRAAWAATLADNQWTIDEMRSGAAWAALNG